ncbi:hypothetical protein Dimus_013082, partial [Dionaea muscipula]
MLGVLPCAGCLNAASSAFPGPPKVRPRASRGQDGDLLAAKTTASSHNQVCGLPKPGHHPLARPGHARPTPPRAARPCAAKRATSPSAGILASMQAAPQ